LKEDEFIMEGFAMKSLIDVVNHVVKRIEEQPLTKLEFRPFVFNDGTVIAWQDEQGRMRLRIVAGAPERIDFTLDIQHTFDDGFERLKEFEYVVDGEQSTVLVHFHRPNELAVTR